MKITAKEITAELQTLWPNLVDVWPMDSEFWCPTYKELQDSFERIAQYREEAAKILHLPSGKGFTPMGHDCDNYALELQADISRYRYFVASEKSIEFEDLLSWPFGTALCMRVNGESINHAVNICRTRDAGIVFIEPQDFSTWVANKVKDFPYFVEMR